MAQSAKINQREREIGQRLRNFRETKLISRTAFATSIGIGYQRLESYEAGRVPLPYKIFKAINAVFFVSPRWLVTGDDPPINVGPIDDSKYVDQIKPSDLLSAVFDRILRKVLEDLLDKSGGAFSEFFLQARQLEKLLADPKQRKLFDRVYLEELHDLFLAITGHIASKKPRSKRGT